MGNIQYFQQQQIDKSKWDACIDGASNGLIYAYSYYLDIMSKNWDALVLGDYKCVMPLTWNKKYGVHYLYQPPLAASLGVFGKEITASLLDDFLKAIPDKFKYWDISFNHGNFFQLKDFDLHERINYVLPLNESYDKIAAGYSHNTKRTAKKSQTSTDLMQKDIHIGEVIALAQERLQHVTKLSDEDFDRFKTLYDLLYKKQMATTYAVYTAQRQLVASAAFFFSHKRAYFILAGNHPNGRTLGASHALLDSFIQEHAGQNLLLDFEGSDLRNLAFFFSTFGATVEKYSAIKLNRLPGYLRWMKK